MHNYLMVFYIIETQLDYIKNAPKVKFRTVKK